MSRSFKKYAAFKDTDTELRITHRMRSKTIANRTVRHSLLIPSGKGGFRKIYDSRNICFHKSVGFPNEKEARRRIESLKRFSGRDSRHLWLLKEDPTEKSIRKWKKFYKSK